VVLAGTGVFVVDGTDVALGVDVEVLVGCGGGVSVGGDVAVGATVGVSVGRFDGMISSCGELTASRESKSIPSLEVVISAKQKLPEPVMYGVTS
jgi:hypothetical protein